MILLLYKVRLQLVAQRKYFFQIFSFYNLSEMICSAIKIVLACKAKSSPLCIEIRSNIG